MKAGFDAHLTKPVPAEDLRRLLAEISSGALKNQPRATPWEHRQHNG
jgi:hypothetical protein